MFRHLIQTHVHDFGILIYEEIYFPFYLFSLLFLYAYPSKTRKSDLETKNAKQTYIKLLNQSWSLITHIIIGRQEEALLKRIRYAQFLHMLWIHLLIRSALPRRF